MNEHPQDPSQHLKPTQEKDNAHPAGPNAGPGLTDSEKTPGTGMLPEDNDPNVSPSG
jgi:hypothetical protein